jgi:hypothetical protein
MQTNLRYWEYYHMTDTFTDLYERSKQIEENGFHFLKGVNAHA